MDFFSSCAKRILEQENNELNNKDNSLKICHLHNVLIYNSDACPYTFSFFGKQLKKICFLIHFIDRFLVFKNYDDVCG